MDQRIDDLEQEVNEYISGLPGFDLDVYRDIFS